MGVATVAAMLTALGQQAQLGRYDLGLVLSVGLASWCGAMTGFIHGLGLPQE